MSCLLKILVSSNFPSPPPPPGYFSMETLHHIHACMYMYMHYWLRTLQSTKDPFMHKDTCAYLDVLLGSQIILRCKIV